MNRPAKRIRRASTLPNWPPGHPLYAAAQQLRREQAELQRAERERAPTPLPSPPPPPSDPETDLDTEEPYQLLLQAVKKRECATIASLLQRDDVKATLASKRSHRKAIPLLSAAVRLPQMDVLQLLLGLSRSSTPSSTASPGTRYTSSVDPTTGLVVTRSMNAWPWVFRGALLSRNGGDVLRQVFAKHWRHERNLVKVFTVLLAAANELSPSVGPKALVNHIIRNTDRITGETVERVPLDFAVNRYDWKVLPTVAAFLVRNGADTSRIVSQSTPRVSFLKFLFSPSLELSNAFWPSSSTTDGEENFADFVAGWWEADWAYAREANTLDTVFPRWLKELDDAVTEHIPKFTNPDSRAINLHCTNLEKRLIVLGRLVIAKYKELGQQQGPESQYRRAPDPAIIRALDLAGLLTYFNLWVPLKL
ncbi:hypothetical protein V8F20_007915 [Naviculisporaceae sp. PSN 640]